MDELLKRFDDLAGSGDSLEAKMTELRPDIEGLIGQVEALKSEGDGLNSRIRELQDVNHKLYLQLTNEENDEPAEEHEETLKEFYNRMAGIEGGE